MPDLPAGRTRMVQRLGDREDIAVHPADALDHDEPHEEAHFHRPGEVLIPDDVDQIALFERTAGDLGLRYHRDGSDPEGPADRDTDFVRGRPRSGTLGTTGAVRYLIRSRSPLETVLRRLERASRHDLHVTPNHVLFGCPVWGFEPSGDPRVAGSRARPHVGGGGHGVIVALVDTGVPRHFTDNELLQTVETTDADLEPWSYSGSDHVLTSPEGHGSFVAGVVRQVAGRATVRSYRVLDVDGVTDEWFLGHQLALALAAGAQVVNLSLGTSTRGDRPLLGLRGLQTAARRAVSPGGPVVPIVVAAAGNLAGHRPFYPAAESWVLGVGAVRPTESAQRPVRARFSNFGGWVDTCALGVDVLSSYEKKPFRPHGAPSTIVDFDGFAVWDGTSFAAPRVSGAVAEVLADRGPLDLADVKEALASRPGAEAVPGLGCYVP